MLTFYVCFNFKRSPISSCKDQHIFTVGLSFHLSLLHTEVFVIEFFLQNLAFIKTIMLCQSLLTSIRLDGGAGAGVDWQNNSRFPTRTDGRWPAAHGSWRSNDAAPNGWTASNDGRTPDGTNGRSKAYDGWTNATTHDDAARDATETCHDDGPSTNDVRTTKTPNVNILFLIAFFVK